MGASQQIMLGYAGGIVVPFLPWDIWGESTIGVIASAGFTLTPDGGAQSTVSDADGGGTDGSLEYYSPNITGIGSLFWVRYTPTVGSFTTNEASTWTQLSTFRSCTKSASTGTASVTFTIEIAADSGGSVVLMTSTGNVLRYTHV